MNESMIYWKLQVVLEKTPERPLDNKEIKPINLKGSQSWIFIGKTDAEVSVFWSPDAKLTHWRSPWCWEVLRAEREEDNRGLNGWMASLMQWTWTWANSRRWWERGRSGMLQPMGLQKVKRDWMSEKQQQQLFSMAEAMVSVYAGMTASEVRCRNRNIIM